MRGAMFLAGMLIVVSVMSSSFFDLPLRLLSVCFGSWPWSEPRTSIDRVHQTSEIGSGFMGSPLVNVAHPSGGPFYEVWISFGEVINSATRLAHVGSSVR